LGLIFLNYIQLLKQSQTVRILTTVQIIAYFGSWFSHVAILALLVKLGASAFIISLAVAMAFLPALIQGPFVGALIDRSEPKKLMNRLLFIESVCTFLFVFIEGGEHIWLLLILVYIKMAAAGLYFTSEMSLMPKVLQPSELKLANEMHSIVWSVSFTVGMALGGLAVQFLGIKAAFLIDASLFLVAIAVFNRLCVNIKPSKLVGSYLDSFKEGISYVFRQNPRLLIIIGLHATVGLTVFDGVITVLAEHSYKGVVSVALAIGFIGAIRSVALVIGPFLFSKLINKERLLYMFLAQGVAIILWGALSHDFWLSLIGSFFCGLFTTTIWSYTMTMLQDSIDKEFYGRVVAINDMFFTATAVMTSIILGAMMESGISGGATLMTLGGVFIVIAVVYGYTKRTFVLKSQK
jgi:DHA3 family macrolide efflux protein-like MFS transporter